MKSLLGTKYHKFNALSALAVGTATVTYLLLTSFNSGQVVAKEDSSTLSRSTISASALIDDGTERQTSISVKDLKSITSVAPWVALVSDSRRFDVKNAANLLDTTSMTAKPYKMMGGKYDLSLLSKGCPGVASLDPASGCELTKRVISGSVGKLLAANKITPEKSAKSVKLFNGIFFITGERTYVVDANAQKVREIPADAKMTYSIEKKAYFYPQGKGAKTEIKMLSQLGFFTAGNIPSSNVDKLNYAVFTGDDKFMINYETPEGETRNGLYDAQTKKVKTILKEYSIQDIKPLTPSCTIAFVGTKRKAQEPHIYISNICQKNQQ